MQKKLGFQLNSKSQIAVLGLGRFGSTIARYLINEGWNVFGCDIDAKKTQAASDYMEYVVTADASNADFLDGYAVATFDMVIIAFSDDFEGALLTVMRLKESGHPNILVKSTDDVHRVIFEKVGADYIVLPEIIMGERIAQTIISNNPLSYIDNSDIFHIEQIIPKHHWIDKTLLQLNLPKKENLNILGIIRNEELVNPINASTEIEPDDLLIVMRNQSKKKNDFV